MPDQGFLDPPFGHKVISEVQITYNCKLVIKLLSELNLLHLYLNELFNLNHVLDVVNAQRIYFCVFF
jgi:hypothetical protein